MAVNKGYATALPGVGWILSGLILYNRSQSEMDKYLIAVCLLLSLAACRHVRYTQTGSHYNANAPQAVTVHTEGSPIPTYDQQVGIMQYKARSQEHVTRKAQRLAARHGATDIYQPMPPIRYSGAGMVLKGTLIAVRHDYADDGIARTIRQLVAQAPFRIGDHVQWQHPNKAAVTKQAVILAPLNRNMYLIRFDRSHQEKRAAASALTCLD